MQRRSSFNFKLLSIVVPSYKQEKTIVKDIKNIAKALDGQGYKYEIIVVVDGMVDKTYNKASKLRSSKIKVISYEKNYGKGHAVRFGMMKAKGDIIGFIDAGMDIHPSGFRMLLNHMEWYNADIIVGSKMHPVSKVRYPLYRSILSWGYRLLTATLFGFKIKDTQVGIKFFKRKVARDVFPRLLVKRYAFDVEVLAVAHLLGYHRIYEAPIKINFNNDSVLSNNLMRSIINMLIDTLAVFYRLKIRRYYTAKRLRGKMQSDKLSLSLERN